MNRHIIVADLVLGFISGLIVGLFFGLVSLWVTRMDGLDYAGVVLGVATLFVVVFAFYPGALLFFGLAHELVFGSAFGLASGLIFGLAFGSVSGLAFGSAATIIYLLAIAKFIVLRRLLTFKWK